MAKLDVREIQKQIELLELKVFPAYAEALGKEQQELLAFLNGQKLNKDQIIAGLIQGMSHTSFQLAVKLSFLLAVTMQNPDFDLENPVDLEEFTSILVEKTEPIKEINNSLN